LPWGLRKALKEAKLTAKRQPSHGEHGATGKESQVSNAAKLRRVAEAIREWMRRIEDGSVAAARRDPLEREVLRAKGEASTDQIRVREQEARTTIQAHKAAARAAFEAVKRKLYLLTTCANTYGCRAQERLDWLKGAVLDRDPPVAFARYREYKPEGMIGPGRKTMMMSVLARDIDTWADELEKAEHVAPPATHEENQDRDGQTPSASRPGPFGRPRRRSPSVADSGAACMKVLILVILVGLAALAGSMIARGQRRLADPAAATARFKLPAMWEYTAPLIAPRKRQKDPSVAQKDPTLVHHEGKWHVFMTVKLPGRTAIEYCCFEEWENADRAPRTILKVTDGRYYGAPQVFYFAPHRKWYLIYQLGVPTPRKMMWVAYSTTANIADPNSWTQARPILDGGRNDPRKVGGLDYWIICDDRRAYLFLTSLNGRMWRLWTKLEDFPKGFHDCRLALQARIFEASHTYRLKGLGKYLTIVEENGRRYYKAYLADRLDGPWTPLADTAEKPFAGWKNIRPAKGVEPWTDNVSHGELIRAGNDQTMTVDPNRLRFVFQGLLDKDKRGKGYGKWPWRIGMLTPVAPAGG